MKNFVVFLFVVFLPGPTFSQATYFVDIDLNWTDRPEQRIAGDQPFEQWSFPRAVFTDEQPGMPFCLRSLPLPGPGQARVTVESVRFEPFSWEKKHPATLPPAELDIRTAVEKDRSRHFLKIALTPIIRDGGGYRRARSLRLRIDYLPSPVAALRNRPYARNSVLRQGAIYQLAVSQTGIHKLDYNLLQNELGIELAQIPADQLRLFARRGGLLATDLDATTPYTDDLAELPVLISDGGDNRLDPGDYLLCYIEGPDTWRFDAESGTFAYEKNIYDTRNYLFLKIDGARSRPIPGRQSIAATHLTEAFTERLRYEEDRVNLLHYWGEVLGKAQGSGQNWYGDHFKNLREYNYPELFQAPGLLAQEPARLEVAMALRAERRSRFIAELDGRDYNSGFAAPVAELSGPNDNINDYAKPALLDQPVLLDGETVNLRINYPFPAGSGDGSEGWLDYIQLECRRRLVFAGNQLAFRDPSTLDHPASTYQLSGLPANALIWEVTDPLNPVAQSFNRTGANAAFGVENGGLREFVAFDPAQVQLRPAAVAPVANQNLHSIDEVDMVILHPADFAEAAARLAQHRRNHSGLSVALVDVDQLYNEFGGGRKDPTAIRDFAHMLYLRNPGFRYLLLFGDGSFDQRDIYGLGNNFIPTYQRESLNPLFAFPSDDYFVLLEPSDGNVLGGRINVAVGRLPVKTPEEARVVVDKIMNYDQNPETFGDWRNRLAFVGDDEDFMQHTRDADRIADDIAARFPLFNIDKIYLDAFQQVATPGGNRFPEVTRSINETIFKGALVITYLGHGGAQGWAQERVLNVSDIIGWENTHRQPLFLTATCSFTGYDDPAFTSAGEEVFLNPKGGGIGLMTTVRAVFANQNAALTGETLQTLFSLKDGRIPTLGEAIMNAKNNFTGTGITTNSRKFTLIGDPAQRLALPDLRIRTTAIDQQPLDSLRSDTIRALQRVTISGAITDAAGNPQSGFSGILYPTVFDKSLDITTLGQDARSYPYDFQLQKNVIFKGRTSVENGAFSFTFVVPKDINYAYGPGKVSYYAAAAGARSDAAGAYEGITIGGNDPNALADNEGPKVEVFMNTEDFVFGGITDPNPTLLVRLEDDNGINVVGNSIGHDLEGILDENTQNTILLNDFFESDLDDYRRGAVRYPLEKLAEGRHQIRVKAWDVANNASEGYTEFVVAGSEAIALRHVLNYPNPFTDRTCFQFDHNLAGEELQVLIQIYTVSGRLVKTLERTFFSDGAIRQDDCIPWDGRDDFGDPLARGIYLYKVRVRAPGAGNGYLEGESGFEKLVLLK